jgi:hypothetical protein
MDDFGKQLGCLLYGLVTAVVGLSVFIIVLAILIVVNVL